MLVVMCSGGATAEPAPYLAPSIVEWTNINTLYYTFENI